MMILAIWAVIVAALLVLLPMAVVEWWDLWERWRAGRRDAGPEQLPGCRLPQEREAGLRDRELRRMAALCQIGQSAGTRPKEGD